jgi:TolB protein
VRFTALLAVAALVACSSSSSDPPACDFATAGAPWLAFSRRASSSYQLFIVRADGGCLRQVTSGAADDLFPSFGPGGTIAFERASSLRIHRLTNCDDWAVGVGTLAATSPAFSPDGRLLAFEGRVPGSTEPDVYVVPIAGGDPVRLTDDPASDAGPAWSPNGATIYFVSTRSGAYEVWAVPAAGGAAARVTTGSRIVGKPAVSPDGAALYFGRTVAGASDTTEVVRYDLATGATAVVSSQQDSEPAVSPRGDRLAVRSYRSGHPDLWVVGAQDGSSAVQITGDSASDGLPSFAPAR